MQLCAMTRPTNGPLSVRKPRSIRILYIFVTDDPEPRLNISRSNASVSALAIFSDGVERLALDMAAQKPFKPFFDGMIRPPSQQLRQKDVIKSCLYNSVLI